MVQKDSINKYNCIIVLGPTASGKSDIAMQLAKRYKGNIINCDSQQIYKGISIGTAKPSTEDFREVKHHLFDYVDLGEDYSVSRYYNDAIQIFDNLVNEEILPVFVGGTGLYIDSLLHEHDYGFTDKNNVIRDKYTQLYKEKGNEYIYNLLQSKDKKSAEKIHPNDIKRIIRALEIADSGQLKSQQVVKENSKIKPFIIYVNMDREILYDRINSRVDKMIEEGLESEVEYVNKLGYFDIDIKLPIGYSEWKNYYANTQTKESTIELIKQHSRNYAKRQITWFKRTKYTIEYNPLSDTMQNLYDKLDVHFNRQ